MTEVACSCSPDVIFALGHDPRCPEGIATRKRAAALMKTPEFRALKGRVEKRKEARA